MSPEAMVNATTGHLRQGELLYVATDEEDANFLVPFRDRYVFVRSVHGLLASQVFCDVLLAWLW